jgi:hypothetical protein
MTLIPIKCSVIAVTGLAGHAFESWRNRDTQVMWLRDLLPKDVPNIRIMTWGYNTSLDDHTSSEHFEEYRTDLLQAISLSRRTGEVRSQPLRAMYRGKCNEYLQEMTRPIIFIGYGIGGLLILQVLLFGSYSSIHILTGGIQALLKSKSDTQYQDTFTSTRQVLLFGVPHQGMEIEDMIKMVEDTGGKSSTRLDLVQSLSEGSNFLNTQRADIVNLWPDGSDITIVSFYESLKSPTVEKVSKNESV